MASVRLFVAIEIPSGIKFQITQVVSQLRAARPDVKWELPEKLHVTLTFLGEVDEEMLPQIVLLLEGVAERTFPFSIRIAGSGFFPDKHDPRIIWVGIEDVEHKLEPLVESLETELASIGFEREEKEFHPHVTIGRIKTRKNLESLHRTIQSVTFESQPTRITEIVLIKSELRPEGSVHTIMQHFSYAKQDDNRKT